jgi:hypothetical protein
MKKCEMKECEYENLTGGPFCHNCNANIRTWARRPVGDLLKRQKKLRYYSTRMSFVELKVKKGVKK